MKQENIPAKERAYQYVRSLIVGHEVPEGGFIGEAEIAAAIGVSRTPVREALFRLEAEHLLQLVPRKGAMVAPISSHELDDLMETRLVIELFAAEQIVDGRLEVAGRLEGLIRAQREFVPASDARPFIDHDRSFHQEMVRATGNEVMAQLYDSLRDRQLRAGLAAVLDSPGRLAEVVREHEAIQRAAANFDLDAMKDAIRDHLATTLKVLHERPSPYTSGYGAKTSGYGAKTSGYGAKNTTAGRSAS